MMLEKKALYGFLVALCLGGYPVLAAISAATGLPNYLLSMSVRSIMVVIGLTLFLTYRFRDSDCHIYFYAFSAFWIFYVLRIFSDTTAVPAVLSKPADYYWVFAIGGSLLPVLGLWALRTEDSIDSAFKFALPIMAVGGLIVALLGGVAVVSDSGAEYDSGRLRLDALNPISVGHFGASLAILSGWGVAVVRGGGSWVTGKMFCIFGMGLGLYLLLASASRGPLVAFLFVVLVLCFALDIRRMLIAVPIFALVGVAMFAVAQQFQADGQFALLSRVMDSRGGDDASVSARLIAFHGGWNQFLDNPFFGSGLEERQTGTYPHSVIIEAFMATGLVGGAVFLAMIIKSLVFSWNLLASRSRYGWVALIFIQYFVGTQFSGAIYGSTTFWAFMVILLAGLGFKVAKVT